MTTPNHLPVPLGLRLNRMQARDRHEIGRTATPLELFFDLVFVVAVANAGYNLHHALSNGHVVHGLTTYALMFFSIWWAWMNFTWFATSFSTDDWLYRVLTIVQMTGVLILAAGMEPAFHGDYLIPVIGYIVMRIAMVSQWLRAARAEPELRRTATTYAAGIAVLQLFWLGMLFVPNQLQLPLFLVLIGAELAVPLLAERHGNTPWHPHHITERYSLFVLILLGESLLASANALIKTLHAERLSLDLIGLAAMVIVITASLWWIYFWPPHSRCITTLRRSVQYGYTHYFVFAAAGALSAGIEVYIDVLSGSSSLGFRAAEFAVNVPIAAFVVGIWWIAIRHSADRTVTMSLPAAAAVILIAPVTPMGLTLTAATLVAVVALLVARRPTAAVH